MPQQPLVEPLRRWDPEMVGGYVLIGRLGAGAMGQVYLARSAAGRLVAVKTIKTELAEEPDFRNRFGQEVAAARRVSGAFTAAVVAADSEADVPWLATVYVPAPSLQRLVRSCGPLAVPAVRWLAAGCAEALESIHSVGLVHRDLKPANVLVSPDGPRVIDFGVARAAERIQLTVTHGSIGTPAYMAPEQARDTRQATSASDVFSLGATMLFAATGHAPYQGDTVMDVLVQLATGPPDLTAVPPELAELVAACLERDPRNRPSSASILARLAPVLAGEPGVPPLPAAALSLIEEYRQIPRSSVAHSPGAGVRWPTQADDNRSEGSGGSSRRDAGSGGSGESSRRDAGSGGSGESSRRDAGSGGSGGSSPRDAAGIASPVVSAGNDSAGDDATIGSQPVLAGPAWSATPAPAASPFSPAARSHAPGFGRRLLLTAGTVAAAAALVAAGWVIRPASSRSPSAGDQPSASTSQASSPGATGVPPQTFYEFNGLGPIMGPPPGAPGAPSNATPIQPRPGVPFAGLSADTGDSDTDFVVIGLNWPAGSRVTVSLVGVRSSPFHPPVDGNGAFNYTINQTHEFFRGSLPPGTYTVRVTDAAGASVTAKFRVQPGG